MNKDNQPFKKFYKSSKKSVPTSEKEDPKKSFSREGKSAGKPFAKDKRSTEKPFGKENNPYKKSFNKDERSFKKSSDKQDRPTRKPADKEDHSYKKPFNKDDRPFKKTFGKEDRPARKSFDKEDRPYKKPSDKDDRPFKKTFGKEDRPARKSFDKEDRPYKKTFNKEDRPFKKTFDKDNRPARKPFDKEDRPYKKSFNNEDRPFKKSFDKEERLAPESYDKGIRSYKKSNKEGAPSDSKSFSKPKRSFGKFEEADLSFGKRKKPAIKPEDLETKEPEITFSKTIEDKWETEPVKPPYGKAGAKDMTMKREDRHPKKGSFRKHFDDENPHEKAFESNSNPGRKRLEEESSYYDGKALEGLMPLNKFIAHCDVCSRRDAVVLIKEGKVKVNGELITEPGHKVTIEDQITLSGKKLVVQKNLVYILLNKPKGFITTTDDPKGRRTVMDIFENHIEERIFPVGRLDRNTTGLLLLTNDGELAQDLAHPKFEIRKVYQVSLDKPLAEADYLKIREGVTLEDGPAPVNQLEYLDLPNELGLEIHNGKNRIVRRIFESLGYVVEKLDRVMYAGLTKKNLVRGKWRFLTKQEVINLKHLR
jgi:23S rRNA pseudouridine2605 synthase